MLFSYFLCFQISTSAVLQLESVMSKPTARIVLVLIFVRAKLDTLETEKHAEVDRRTVLLSHEVRHNVVDASEPTIGFNGQ